MAGLLEIVLGAALAGGAVYYLTESGVPMNADTVTALAQKWGSFFGVPYRWLLALAWNESRWNPKATNLKSAGDVRRGGAWGITQQTLATAKDNIAALAKRKEEEIRAQLRKWDGTGKSLYDPDLNIMLAAYLLSRLIARFGEDFAKVMGAYNRGAAGMADYLADGGDPGKLAYVQHVQAALSRYT